MHAASLDVERFRKVRTLHDRTDIPGERAAAASRMEAMARNAGISLDEAIKATGSKPARKPRAKKASVEPRKPTPRRPKAEPRPWEWQKIIIEYGCEDAVLSPGPMERALSRACEGFIVYRAVNGWRVGSLQGWTLDSFEDPPAAVIDAVSAAYPLPATVQGAWAEFRHWTKLFRDRAVFSPRLGTPPLAVEIRKRLLAGLLDVIEARSLNDVRARLDWMDDRAAPSSPRDVEGDAIRLRTLRADFERMAGCGGSPRTTPAEEDQMAPPGGPDLPLFEIAGVEVEMRPRPTKAKRQRKPRPPTPAERATVARLMGARRPACACTDTGRRRVGGPRDLSSPKVFGFPLSRNAAALADAIARLPNFWDDNFEQRWATVGRNYERKLIRRGIPSDAAYASAKDLFDAALDIRSKHDKGEQVSQ